MVKFRHGTFRAETYQGGGNEEGGKVRFKFENGMSTRGKMCCYLILFSMCCICLSNP